VIFKVLSSVITTYSIITNINIPNKREPFDWIQLFMPAITGIIVGIIVTWVGYKLTSNHIKRQIKIAQKQAVNPSILKWIEDFINTISELHKRVLYITHIIESQEHEGEKDIDYLDNVTEFGLYITKTKLLLNPQKELHKKLLNVISDLTKIQLDMSNKKDISQKGRLGELAKQINNIQDQLHPTIQAQIILISIEIIQDKWRELEDFES
jgi:hypothetical protein